MQPLSTEEIDNLIIVLDYAGLITISKESKKHEEEVFLSVLIDIMKEGINHLPI